MSNTVMEKITVERVTQYGVRANGVSYGISPRLKEKGIEPNSFFVGNEYEVEIYVGPKGGRSINSFNLVKTGTVPTTSNVPALPPTATNETKAPGGTPPVAPAKNSSTIAASEDKMTKADWENKSFLIHVDAILKSTLESPALAQLVVGKRLEEAQATKREWFKSSLKDYEDAVNGTL